MTSEVETNIVAVERIKEYGDTAQVRAESGRTVVKKPNRKLTMSRTISGGPVGDPKHGATGRLAGASRSAYRTPSRLPSYPATIRLPRRRARES